MSEKTIEKKKWREYIEKGSIEKKEKRTRENILEKMQRGALFHYHM